MAIIRVLNSDIILQKFALILIEIYVKILIYILPTLWYICVCEERLKCVCVCVYHKKKKTQVCVKEDSSVRVCIKKNSSDKMYSYTIFKCPVFDFLCTNNKRIQSFKWYKKIVGRHLFLIRRNLSRITFLQSKFRRIGNAKDGVLTEYQRAT